MVIQLREVDGRIYIEAPESARNTLYAIEQSRDCFQLALNGRTDTLPPPLTWREYFQDNTEVDPDDHLDVRKWLREEGSYYFKGEELRDPAASPQRERKERRSIRE